MISYFATVSVSVVVLGPGHDRHTCLATHHARKRLVIGKLAPCNILWDVLLILTYASYFFLDELQFHMLDLDPDQQEVDLPNNYIFEVVPNKSKDW